VGFRDKGDAYVTHLDRFTEKIDAIKGALDKTTAGGGGDTPEAARELNHDDTCVVRSSANHATVLLARSRRPLTRDVVVRWTEPTADLDLAGRAARRTATEPAYVSARFGFERDPDAATRTPMRVVFVLDRSLSMAGDPIAHARQLASGVLDTLDPRDAVGLVTFASELQRITPTPATIPQREQIRTELAGAPNGVVVLMTDGQPTAGDGVDDALPAARAADVLLPRSSMRSRAASAHVP
jgi:Mg-chelatase subunit ChlD